MSAKIMRAGVIGGIAGGIVLLAFLLGAGMLTSKAPPVAILTGLLQFSAEWALGKVALTSPSYAWIGAIVHFGSCIAWGVAYAYISQQRPQLIEHPFISGILYGLIVWIGTQLVLVAVGLFQAPNPAEVQTELFAYCLFFGIPLGLTVAKLT